jgi:peptidoglycan-associated lipoprotein
MKKFVSIFLLITLMIIFSSCSHRNAVSMWEDTKTATRYIGRGFKILGGRGGDSRLIHYPYEFVGPEDSDYIAIYEEEDQGGSSPYLPTHPQAKETPGELSSFLPGVDGFHNPGQKEGKIFQHVYFDTNKENIKSREDSEILREIAHFLKKNPSYYVFVEGHCDKRGTDAYNLSLGSRRSNMVRNILIEEGVNLNRLFTISYGKEKPIDPANNPEAWQVNRRVQFKLYKKNK